MFGGGPRLHPNPTPSSFPPGPTWQLRQLLLRRQLVAHVARRSRPAVDCRGSTRSSGNDVIESLGVMNCTVGGAEGFGRSCLLAQGQHTLRACVPACQSPWPRPSAYMRGTTPAFNNYEYNEERLARCVAGTRELVTFVLSFGFDQRPSGYMYTCTHERAYNVYVGGCDPNTCTHECCSNRGLPSLPPPLTRKCTIRTSQGTSRCSETAAEPLDSTLRTRGLCACVGGGVGG